MFPALLLMFSVSIPAAMVNTKSIGQNSRLTISPTGSVKNGQSSVRSFRELNSPDATITVNTNLDNESNGCVIGNCTLREAITQANGTAQTDIIVFDPAVTGTILLTNGQLTVSSNLSINGPGARNLTINGNNTDRVFLIATPTSGGDFTVNISGLKITNGFAQPVLIGSTLIGDGGGILNGALLGILTGTSTLNLTEVAIDNNVATTLGGGVATRLGSITNITRSTVSNNTSNAVVPALGGDVGGGGISNVVGTTTINNSTISDNHSLAAGGGILNAAGVLHLTNNTISHNSSTLAGGGLVSVAGLITPILGLCNLRNTIIADNNSLQALNILGRDIVGVLGSFNSLGNNLIGSNYGAESSFLASVFSGTVPVPNVNGDIIGNILNINQVISPLLGTLQNNGGPTETRLPQPSSPVINRGNNCVLTDTCSSSLALPTDSPSATSALTTDQRGVGFPRQLGSAVEVGAVEISAPTAAGTTISGRVTQSNGKGISRAIVTLTDAEGTIRSVSTNTSGAFIFEAVLVQQTYILQVRHKQYTFTPQIISPTEDLIDVNLIGTPTGFKINSSF